MTTPNIENIIKSLVVKAGVMEMGEKIAWGSDTALMRQAAAALQSQAERIKGLIDSVNFKHSKITELENERDTLRAELEAIAATEPVDVVLTSNYGQLVKVHIADHTLYEVDLSPKPYFQVCWAHGWAGIYSSEDEAAEDCLSLCGHGRSIREIKPGDDGYRNPNAINFIEQRFPVSQLFTHLMPAKNVEAGMIELPEPVAWLANYGGNVYTEAQLKQAVSDALDTQGVNAELVEALEALIESTTGVDQVSVVNDARTALSKYKGAKA